MKKIKSTVLMFLIVFCILFALPLKASAANTMSQDGLEVTIITDANEYAADESVQVSINIKNNNSYKVEDILVETLLPEGLVLETGTLFVTGIDIEAGEMETISVMAQLADEFRDNGDEVIPPTGEKSNIILWAVLAGVSAVCIFLVIKFKKTAKVISFMLCFALILPMIPTDVFASENNTVITVDTEIKIDDNNYVIVSKVHKPINNVAEEQNRYSVIFAVNDGTNGTYEVQIVEKGKRAVKPADPERLDYTFLGWYVEPECINAFDFSTVLSKDITLYAGWSTQEGEECLFGSSSGGGTIFSISGIEMDGEYVRTTINTNDTCTLHVQFLDENTNSIITTVTVETPEYCELTPVSMFVSKKLPEKFVIVANLIDSNGDKLCNPYTCISYTTAYECYSKQTVNDFEGEIVINFDEAIDKNYGVLSDDIKEIITSDSVNKIMVSSQPIVPDDYDGTQEIEYEDILIFENPDSMVAELNCGDKIYVKETQHLIKIGSIETCDDGTVIIIADKDVELSDFYKVLNVDMEIDVNKAEIDQSGPMVIWDILDGESSFSLGGEGKIEPTDWLAIEYKLNGTGRIKVKIQYDVKILKKNYFYISVVTELEVDVNLDIKAKKDNEDDLEKAEEHKALTEISFGKWSVPTPIPGLTISTTPFIPLEWELSAGATFDFSSKTTSGFSYSSDDGIQNIDKKERTIKMGAEGEASVKAGPKIKVSVDFCGKVLQAKVTIGAGVEAKMVAELLATDKHATTADSIHACALCLNGKINWYVEVNAGLSYKLLDGVIEGELVKWDIVKMEGEFPISPNFYISIINDDESPLKGKAFAMGWGECINKAYKTEFVVKDIEGDELSNIDIAIMKGSNDVLHKGKSKLKLYLYEGIYVAVCNVGGVEVKKAFAVKDNAQIINLEANSFGTLSGKICKASDRTTAIPNAKIEIFKDGAKYTTKYANENGNYSLKLAEGNYYVVISAEGYIDFKSYALVKVDTNTYMETFLMIEGEEGEIGTAKGVVFNSLTGQGTSDVSLSVLADWNNTSENANVLKTVKTDDNGEYVLELPLGNYTIVASKDNYTTSFFNIIVQKGVTDNQNGIITPVVVAGIGTQYLITLTWDENPRDLDAHVRGKLNSGDNFHVFFNYTSEFDGDVEVCNLDYDDIYSYGPEHITLNIMSNEPYYYYVHRFQGIGMLTTSGAQVTIEQDNKVIAKFNVPTDLSEADYWNVFAIKNGEIIINNSITEFPDTSYAN